MTSRETSDQDMRKRPDKKGGQDTRRAGGQGRDPAGGREAGQGGGQGDKARDDRGAPQGEGQRS